MKIAYYEENNYHTEIMGTFLEPFVLTDNQFVVYNRQDKSDYVSWYNKFVPYEIKNPDQFMNDCTNYDVIIVGTSTTFTYLEQIASLKQMDENNFKPKIFLITHLKEELGRDDNISKFPNIVLTPLNMGIVPNTHYVLPINNFYEKSVKVYGTKIIGIIGRFKDSNRDVKDLIRLITNYSDLDFGIRIFTRHIKFIPESISKLEKIYPHKIKIYYRKKTQDIINMMHQINYFCPLSSRKSCYVKDRLTGIIPFSFNFNTPMLLDEETNDIYKFNTPIVYKNSLCDVIKNICSKPKEDYDILVQNVIREKHEICEKNRIVMNGLIDMNDI